MTEHHGTSGPRRRSRSRACVRASDCIPTDSFRVKSFAHAAAHKTRFPARHAGFCEAACRRGNNPAERDHHLIFRTGSNASTRSGCDKSTPAHGPNNARLNIALEGERSACLYLVMSTILIEVRRAKPCDATAIAATHDEAWKGAYQGVIPGTELTKLVNRRGPQWWDSAIRKGSRIAVLAFGDYDRRLRQLRSQPRAQPLLRRRDLRALSAAGVSGAGLWTQAVRRQHDATSSRAACKASWFGRCPTMSRRSASTAPSAAKRWRDPPNGSAPAFSTRSRSPGTDDRRRGVPRPS